MAYHNDLGAVGEQLAVNYLSSQGYKILEQNFTYNRAEIDIIASIDDYLVIVEVKTRNSSFFGDPQEFVSKKKVKLLVHAANEYVDKNDLDLEVRFDIISVIKNQNVEQIEHLENAFYHF